MIVFALRHADRTPDPQDDLTPKGAARAKLLARILGESGVSTAFVSTAKRARKTLQPLEAALGNGLTTVPVDVNSPTHVQEHVDGLTALPDHAVAAVVGHSDTIRDIIREITGTDVGEIAAGEFDKLFVLSIRTGGGAMVALTRYGEPT